jgi:hypothetical protein
VVEGLRAGTEELEREERAAMETGHQRAFIHKLRGAPRYWPRRGCCYSTVNVLRVSNLTEASLAP